MYLNNEQTASVGGVLTHRISYSGLMVHYNAPCNLRPVLRVKEDLMFAEYINTRIPKDPPLDFHSVKPLNKAILFDQNE